MIVLVFFFFKQKTAYEMRISDWSSDVCSSDLVAFGRKIATIGLSMKKNVKLAREMGLLTIPESALIDIERIGDYPDSQICVISTGSQGELMSALTRMANQENRWLEVGAGDTVILSSHPIPGNEMDVSKVIDGLTRLGTKLAHSCLHDVHATGNDKQEDIKIGRAHV